MLEIGFLTKLWYTILQRMNTTSKLLQKTLDANTAEFLLHSLKKCSGDPGQTKFRRDVFLLIIDKLSNSLIQLADAYSAVSAKFGFLTKLTNLSANTLKEQCENVRMAYSEDIQSSLKLKWFIFQLI